MSSPTRPSPIPAGQPADRKKNTVLQSSLDLVFSYSRSQQLLYGKNIGSSPSFLEGSPHSSSRHPGYLHDVESGRVSEEEEGEGEGEGEEEGRGDQDDGKQTEDRESDRANSSSVYGAEDLSLHTESPEEAPRRPSVASDQLLFQSGSLGNRSLPTPSLTASDEATPRLSLLPLAPDLSASRPMYKRQPSRMASSSSSSTAKVYGTSSTQKPFEGWSHSYNADEGTPLLPATSDSPMSSLGPDVRRRSSHKIPSAEGRRRSSIRLRKSQVGESTDGQTLFNTVAVLLGIGILSQPLSFAYAGWIGGTFMLVGFAWATCHTAKLLARLIFADSSFMGYPEIGRAAFGSRGSAAVSLLFCLELFALSVAFFVLLGDTLEAINDRFTSDTYKFLSLIVILPSTLLPLRLLSLPSLLSSLSTFLLVFIILLDGFGKTSAPGSILDPSETNLWPEWAHGNWLGGIGLALASFGGHAVVPSLARDMKHPESFDKVISQAFAIATGFSFAAGAAGYLMIGNGVSDEITRDLTLPKYGYSRGLNMFALWMIVIIPLTKFGLVSRPLNVAIETLLGIAKPLHGNSSHLSGVSASTDHSPSSARRPSKVAGETALNESATTRFIFRVVSRTVVTLLAVLTAIWLPGFGKVMAFLGSFSAFLICIILPLGFYLVLQPRLLPGQASAVQKIGHYALLSVSMVLMVAGTVWAFLPESGHGGLEDE